MPFFFYFHQCFVPFFYYYTSSYVIDGEKKWREIFCGEEEGKKFISPANHNFIHTEETEEKKKNGWTDGQTKLVFYNKEQTMFIKSQGRIEKYRRRASKQAK